MRKIDTSGCQAAAAAAAVAHNKIWNYMIESFFIVANSSEKYGTIAWPKTKYAKSNVIFVCECVLLDAN